MTATSKVDVFSDVAHNIYHLLVLTELQAILREIAETDGVADIEATAVGLLFAQQEFDEGRLSRAVASDDAHLLETCEVVVEVLEDSRHVLLASSFADGSEGFRHILALENLRADVDVGGLQAYLPFLDALFGDALEFVERILAVFGFVSACLRHTAHPFQFCAIEIVGACHLGSHVVDALLAFLQVVAVVSAIGIKRLVVDFDDEIADTVEEVAVVGDHEQRLVAASEKAFEPLNHLEVEVVGGLVEDEQLGFGDEHVGESHSLTLAARELRHGLRKVANLQLREYLLGTQHFLVVAFMIEAGIEDGVVGIEVGRLLKIADAQVVAEDNLSVVVALLACDDR